MKTKLEICQDWLPRYLGIQIDELADYILLTNFHYYVERFAKLFKVKINSNGYPMPNATAKEANITIINFGMGSANVATIMDLLIARNPKAVLFLGKCGGLKKSSEIGHFILPIAAIRGEGTSLDYFPDIVPALPSFKLHKYVSQIIVEKNLEYRTGVVYTTNRRVWEYDAQFKQRLQKLKCLAIDMETATIFIVGHHNSIPRGALLIVSDLPTTPEGAKTTKADAVIAKKWTDIHLELGIKSMREVGLKGEQIKHFSY